jgi:flagellar hook assembly protein FlgD
VFSQLPENNLKSAVVDIYSLGGRLIKSCIIDSKNIFTWDGRDMSGNNVASGAYLFKIMQGSKMWMIKGTLIR